VRFPYHTNSGVLRIVRYGNRTYACRNPLGAPEFQLNQKTSSLPQTICLTDSDAAQVMKPAHTFMGLNGNHSKYSIVELYVSRPLVLLRQGVNNGQICVVRKTPNVGVRSTFYAVRFTHYANWLSIYAQVYWSSDSTDLVVQKRWDLI